MKYYNNTDKVISIKLPTLHNGLQYPLGSVRKVEPGKRIMIAPGLLDYNEIPELISSGDLSITLKKDKKVKKVEVIKPKEDKPKKDKKAKGKKKVEKKKK